MVSALQKWTLNATIAIPGIVLFSNSSSCSKALNYDAHCSLLLEKRPSIMLRFVPFTLWVPLQLLLGETSVLYREVACLQCHGNLLFILLFALVSWGWSCFPSSCFALSVRLSDLEFFPHYLVMLCCPAVFFRFKDKNIGALNNTLLVNSGTSSHSAVEHLDYSIAVQVDDKFPLLFHWRVRAGLSFHPTGS